MLRISFILTAILTGFSAYAHSHANYKIDFPLNGSTAFFTWETRPAVDAYASMLVEVVDQDHRPIDLIPALSATVAMPEMNHGNVPTAIERVLDESGAVVTGSYRIKNMSFFMNGMWLVTVKLTSENGSEETGSFEVKVGDEDGEEGGHEH